MYRQNKRRFDKSSFLIAVNTQTKPIVKNKNYAAEPAVHLQQISKNPDQSNRRLPSKNSK